jgi:hypothetical protein
VGQLAALFSSSGCHGWHGYGAGQGSLASKIDLRNNRAQIRKIPESSDGAPILGCVASVCVYSVLGTYAVNEERLCFAFVAIVQARHGTAAV